MLRGPRTPFARMLRVAPAARRAHLRGDRPPPRDRASAARTSSRCCSTPPTRTASSLERAQIRDEVMTLLFAGHDTTTSTVAFLFHELARNPRCWTTADGDRRHDRSTRRCASTRPPTSGRGARSRRSSSTAHACPRGAHVNYCSWASHHLPDVWPEPERVPARSASARRTRRSCRRAPTSRSAAARAPASGCASARRRSRVIAARDPASASGSSCSPGYELEHPPGADDLARATGCRCACGPREPAAVLAADSAGRGEAFSGRGARWPRTPVSVYAVAITISSAGPGHDVQRRGRERRRPDAALGPDRGTPCLEERGRRWAGKGVCATGGEPERKTMCCACCHGGLLFVGVY